MPLIKDNCISVIAADGQTHRSIDFMNIPIHCESQFHILKESVILKITPNLILGIDFWHTFQLCPEYISSIVINNNVN